MISGADLVLRHHPAAPLPGRPAQPPPATTEWIEFTTITTIGHADYKEQQHYISYYKSLI